MFWLAAAVALQAFAEDGPPVLTGRVFTDIYAPTRDEPLRTDLRQASTSIWLQADPKLGERSSAHLTLTGDYFETALPGNPDIRRLRVGLREAYVAYAHQGWEFRVGRQIIPWGKSDAVNPTDFLSAKDYTFLNPDEEVRRVAATSVLTTWTPSRGSSPLSVTFVWTPVFPQTRLLIPPSALPEAGGPVTVDTDPTSPSANLSNSETALRLSYAGDGWDAAVTAFRGFNHMPEFTFSGTTVFPTFNRVRALGADLSFTSGRWIFRGESSYIWTQNDRGTNPLIQPSHWDSVIGIERPVGDDFRAQIQVLYRVHPRFTDPEDAAVGAEIAKANALLLGYQFQSRVGATFRIAYEPEKSDFQAELFTIGNFMGGDYLLRPKLTYAWSDALKTTLGTEYYAGPLDRPLGALQVYNSLFLEAKYSF